MIVILNKEQPIRVFYDKDEVIARAFYKDLSEVQNDSSYIHIESCPLGFAETEKENG